MTQNGSVTPTDSAGRTKTGREIHDHFTARLSEAVVRPGMYGDEMALQYFLDDLAWIDGRESPHSRASEAFSAMGTWSPIGVSGKFTDMFGGSARDHINAVALVYADLAWAWGYLTVARTLDREEYARLRRDAPPWTAAADRVIADVVAEFGEPSLWTPKYNPCWPQTIGYVPQDRSDPLVVFDFWQDTDWASGSFRSRFGPEPVLRNVRWRGDSFAAGFTFTPTGSTLRVRD